MSNKLTIDLKQLVNIALTDNSNYKIVLGEDFVREIGNNLSPSPELELLTFTPGADVVSNLQLQRSYLANKENLIFSSNTPQITDFDPTNTDYTITLSSTNGKFSLSSLIRPVNTLTFTSSKSDINTNIFKDVRFYPDPDEASNFNIQYTQTKAGIVQLSTNIPLVGSPNTFSKIYTFTSSTTYLPSNEDLLYTDSNELLIVGGGGAGVWASGGAGGSVNSYQNINILDQSYNITVGVGGQPWIQTISSTSTWNVTGDDIIVEGPNVGQRTKGQASSAFGFSALGGGGAKTVQTDTETFGSGGDNENFNGAPDRSQYPLPNAGGGGAGAGGNGLIGEYDGEDPANWTAGDGGPGVPSSITGSLNYYGGGGGGGNRPMVPGGSGIAGRGGLGGGGAGGGFNKDTGSNDAPAVGAPNTGGGGGGAQGGFSGTFLGGRAGGSGVVILKLS